MAPSSLGSQSTLVPGPVSLTLFKLSFCTTANLRSNLLWTHLPNRDDLFAVFDSLFHKDLEGSVAEKKVLRLIRGGDLLEIIELETLVLQARLDEERSRSQYLQDVDRHVIIMVKKPLLAIRYQIPTGQIRRLQMNFRPESGFDAAYLALQALGLPIRDRSQQPTNPFSTTTSLSPLPQIFITQQPRSVGLLPSPDFDSRPTTTHGYEHRPSSSAADTPSERPYTAPMTFSQMLPPRRELPFAPLLPKPQNNGAVPAAQNASQPTSLQSQASSKIKPKSKSRAKMAQITAPESQTDSGHPALQSESQSSTTEPKKRKSRAQPVKKKASPLLATTGTEKSTQTLAPSPVIAHHRLADTTNPERQSKNTQSSQKQQIEGQRVCPSQQSQQDLPPTVAAVAIKPPASMRNDVEQPAHAPLVLHLGPKAMAAISAKETNARQDPLKPGLAEANDATLRCLSSTGEISPEEYMSRLDDWVRRYQDLPAPKPGPSPVSDLTAYAAQSEADRLAVVDDMICEYLEDENFIKLVEDVERSWKRIGLGF